MTDEQALEARIARYMCAGHEVIDLQTNETVGEWSTPKQAIYAAEAMNIADRRALVAQEAKARACLTALSEAGYVVVPREPTDAMLTAGSNQMAYVACGPRAVWNAMRRTAEGIDDSGPVAAGRGET